MARLTCRVRVVALLGLVSVLIAGCAGDNPFSGGNVFAKLMRLPDVDQVTPQYQQAFTDVRNALSAGVPGLASWTMVGEQEQAACGSDYPAMSKDGETRDLPNYVVYANLPDGDYERALPIIGAAAQKYGFTPAPQRMHDAAGDHDSFFHNAADGGSIYFGTAKNTVIGISIACHLTAEAKKRGTPSKCPFRGRRELIVMVRRRRAASRGYR